MKGHWLGGCLVVRNHRTPLQEVREAQSGISMELSESGSDSQVPQTLLGTKEDPVLGSLGCTEARDVRFSVLDTAARCHGRAENRVGPWLDSGPGQREKGQGEGGSEKRNRWRYLWD